MTTDPHVTSAVAEMLSLIERQQYGMHLSALSSGFDVESLDRMVLAQANAIANANGFFDYGSMLEEIIASYGHSWCEKKGFFDIESA